MSASSFDGGCDCGSVRYRMNRKPLFVNCCHCRWCQRESGSAFALNALIEMQNVHISSGETEIVDTPSQSGKGQKIVRCSKCRIALWSHYGGIDKLAFIRVGTLDEPDLHPPMAHIYTASKQPWVTLAADVPAFSGYYKSSEVWTQESLVRRAALFS
jgi:hypothetical protein